LQYRKVVFMFYSLTVVHERSFEKTLWENALSHFVVMWTGFMEHGSSREADNALVCQEMFLPMEPKGSLPSSQKPKPILTKLIPVHRVVH
jgi:hypothetical protein